MISVLSRRTGTARRPRSLLASLLAWDADYRSRCALSALSDAQLKDVGLRPTEVRRAEDITWPAPRWITQPW